MKRLNDAGVIGILDRILTTRNAPDSCESQIDVATTAAEPQPALPAHNEPTRQLTSVPVWRGRPPRKPMPANNEKQKLTIRVNSDLADQYRNWSWECRLQLSPLIEEALQEYLRMKRKHAAAAR